VSVPKTDIWIDFAQYGVAQTVGAIKARVQERGGQIRPETVTRRAARLDKGQPPFSASEYAKQGSMTLTRGESTQRNDHQRANGLAIHEKKPRPRPGLSRRGQGREGCAPSYPLRRLRETATAALT